VSPFRWRKREREVWIHGLNLGARHEGHRSIAMAFWRYLVTFGFVLTASFIKMKREGGLSRCRAVNNDTITSLVMIARCLAYAHWNDLYAATISVVSQQRARGAALAPKSFPLKETMRDRRAQARPYLRATSIVDKIGDIYRITDNAALTSEEISTRSLAGTRAAIGAIGHTRK